jgi:hypothetical protein
MPGVVEVDGSIENGGKLWVQNRLSSRKGSVEGAKKTLCLFERTADERQGKVRGPFAWITKAMLAGELTAICQLERNPIACQKD